MKALLFVSIGLSSGFTTAAALFALIVTIGVLSRLAQMTRTFQYIHWYERCFMLGCMLGNILYMFEIPTGCIPQAGIAIAGLFTGIYLGCFIGALAEVLQIFSIIFRRLHWKSGMKILVFGMAAGKIIGALFGFFV